MATERINVSSVTHLQGTTVEASYDTAYSQLYGCLLYVDEDGNETTSPQDPDTGAYNSCVWSETSYYSSFDLSLAFPDDSCACSAEIDVSFLCGRTEYDDNGNVTDSRTELLRYTWTPRDVAPGATVTTSFPSVLMKTETWKRGMSDNVVTFTRRPLACVVDRFVLYRSFRAVSFSTSTADSATITVDPQIDLSRIPCTEKGLTVTVRPKPGYRVTGTFHGFHMSSTIRTEPGPGGTHYLDLSKISPQCIDPDDETSSVDPVRFTIDTSRGTDLILIADSGHILTDDRGTILIDA